MARLHRDSAARVRPATGSTDEEAAADLAVRAAARPRAGRTVHRTPSGRPASGGPTPIRPGPLAGRPFGPPVTTVDQAADQPLPSVAIAVLEREALRQSILRQASDIVARPTDRRTAFRQLSEIGLQLPGVESCGIQLWDRDSGLVEIGYEVTIPEWPGVAEAGKWIPLASAWPFAHLLDDARPVHHWRSDPAIGADGTAFLADSDVGCLLECPMVADGRLLGSLGFYARADAPFPTTTLELGAELAAQTGVVVREMEVREITARISDERAMLLRVSTAANSSLDLDVVLTEIASASVGVAGAERCRIDLPTDDGRALAVAAQASVPDWPFPPDDGVGQHIPIGAWSIDDRVVTSRTPFIVDGPDDPQVVGRMRDDLLRAGTRAILLAPLWAGDEFVGVVSTFSRRRGAFGGDELALMGEVAQRTLVAIQNARRLLAERTRADQQAALLRVSRAATSSLDLYPVLHEICAACLGIAGTDGAEVKLYDARRDDFEVAGLAVGAGYSHPVSVGDRFPHGYWAHIDPLVTGQREPIVIGDIDDPLVCPNLRRKMEVAPIASLVIVPLWHGATCHGALALFCRRTATFSDEHLELAAQIARQAAIAVQNARLMEAERRAALERGLFLEISAAAASDLPTTDLLHRIAEAGLQLPGADACEIDLFDPATRELQVGAAVAVPTWRSPFAPRIGDRYPVDSWTLDAEAVAGAAPIVVHHRDDPRIDDTMRADWDRYGIGSLLLHPLRSHGRCFGLFSLFGRQPAAFGDPELALAGELAARAGAAVAHALATDRERHLAAHRGTLLRIGAAATSSLDLATMLAQVAAELRTATGAPAIVVELWHPDRQDFEVVLSQSEPGPIQPPPLGARFPRSALAVYDRLLVSTAPFAVDLSCAGPDDHPDRERLAARGAATLICAPLWTGGRCLGVVTLYDGRPDPLDEALAALLQEAGDSIALAVSNARLVEDERRRSLERSVLLEVGRAADVDAPLEEQLRLIAQACLALPEVEGATISNYIPERGVTSTVVDVAIDDWPGTDPPGTTYPLHDSPWLLDWLEHGRPRINDIDDPDIPPAMLQEITSFGGQASLWVGLRLADATFGGLGFHTRRRGAFTDATVAVASEIASQISLIIRNANLTHVEARRSLERAVLLEVSRAATADLPLDEKLRRIAEACLAIPEVECASVTNLDPERNASVIVADVSVRDWGDDAPPGTVIDLDRHPTQAAWFASGHPVIHDVDDPACPPDTRAEILGFGGRASLWVGLRLGDAVIGNFSFHSRHSGAIGPATVPFALEVAAQTALTIRNARLFEETQRRAAEQEALFRTSQAATSSLDVDVMLTEAARALREVTQTEAVAVERWVPEEDVFQLATRIAVWDWTGGDPLGTRYPRSAVDFYDRVLTDRRAWTVGPADVPAGHRFLERVSRHGVQSLLIAPLWAQDTCLGAIAMIDRRPGYYTPGMVQLAEQAAGQVALALANVTLLDRERQRADDRATLLRISQEITTGDDLALQLHAAAEALRLATGVGAVEIERWRPERDAFEVLAVATQEGRKILDDVGSFNRRADYPLYDVVLRGGPAYTIRRTDLPESRPERVGFDTVGIETAVVAPLVANDQTVGLLALYALDDVPVPDRIVRLAEEAAAHIGLGMANADLLEQERRQALEQSVMAKVGQAAISPQPLAEKLARIAALCLELPEVEGATIEYWYPGRRVVEVVADATVPDWNGGDPPGTRYDIVDSDWIVGWRQAGGPRIFDVADPDLDPHIRADILGYDAATSIWDGVELDAQTAVLIGFHSRASGVFTAQTAQFTASIAAQTALAVRNERLLAETQRYANEQAALLRVSRAISSVTPETLGDSLRQIAALSMSVVDAELCEILLWHRDVDATEIVAQVTAPSWTGAEEPMNVLVPLAGRPTAQEVLHERRAVILRPGAAYTATETQRIWSDDTRSGLAAPLVLGNRAIGFIGYFSEREDAFTEHHASLAVDLAAQTALAIERANTLSALAEQATTDGLTGLLNHRAVRDRLDVELVRARRREETVAVCMVDLNRFKEINDSHGHLVGDQVLQHAAGVLTAATRMSDVVGRYGGDEFLVILPDTDAVEAVVVADRMLAMAAKTMVPLPNGELLTPSLSIGFAVYPTDATTRPELVAIADRAMYEAKAKAKSSGDGAGARRSLAHGTAPLSSKAPAGPPAPTITITG